jgi:Flp pilus assembly protein TadD
LLSRYPDSPELLRYLGLGHLRLEELPSAERYLERAFVASPSSADVLNELGIVKLKQGACEQALNFFTRALKVDPYHRDALNNIATTFNVLRQPSLAQSYLDRLIRAAPLSAHVHVKAAENSLALHNVELAIQRGRQAVRLAPGLAAARLVLAEALEARGRFKQAKFHYLAVLAREPCQVAALGRLLSQRSGK